MTTVRAVRLGRWSVVTLVVASAVGVVTLGWPFFVSPSKSFEAAHEAPLLFAVLLLLVVAVVLVQLSDGGIDVKALAILGVLSGIGAVLRPLGAGLAGLETVFFLLVVAGRVLGAGFGFVLGSTTLFASALLTGGVGPWLPFQMFATAWVGLGAGLLPPVRGRLEVLLLAGYGAVSAFCYGFVINLSTWPFLLGGDTGLSFDPALSAWGNLHRYLLYDLATSLGWDVGRALTNGVLLLLSGRILLATLRRAARRAAFDAPVEFRTD